jgi:pilus assembly protein CpaB
MGFPMNRRLITILLVAFFIAAMCTFVVYRLVSGQLSVKRPSATTQVVAANADIKLGTIIKAENLQTIEIAGVPPEKAILAKNQSTVIGRGVISDLYKGEPILESRLSAPGSGGGLAPAIPLGMRACAVRVDDVVDVSGFVTPGMRVDVLISGIPPGAQSSAAQVTESRTLLQNLQVLSAGTEYQKDAEGKAKPVQTVNLLVTPEQAEMLSLASNQVKIQLVLRNPLDTKEAPVLGTNAVNLFAGPNAAAEKPKQVAVRKRAAAPQVFSIELMNGSKQSEEKFASPGGRQ